MDEHMGITAISSSAALILGVLLTKGVDAIIKVMRARATIDESGEELSLRGWEKMAIEMSARIASTEDELRKAHHDHMQCVRDHATLLERVSNQDVAIRKLEVRLEKAEKAA